MKLTIEITEEQKRKLGETAERLGVSESELARSLVNDQLTFDPAFTQSAARVMEKNRELYERLK